MRIVAPVEQVTSVCGPSGSMLHVPKRFIVEHGASFQVPPRSAQPVCAELRSCVLMPLNSTHWPFVFRHVALYIAVSQSSAPASGTPASLSAAVSEHANEATRSNAQARRRMRACCAKRRSTATAIAARSSERWIELLEIGDELGLFEQFEVLRARQRPAELAA